MKDYIMVAPNGTLKGMTRGIAYELGIEVEDVSEMTIFDICYQFKSINEVYNKMAIKEILRNGGFEEDDLELEDITNKKDKNLIDG